MSTNMTAEEIVEFKTNKSFFTPEGRKIIKDNSIDILQDATKLDKSIFHVFKILAAYSEDLELRRKLKDVLS